MRYSRKPIELKMENNMGKYEGRGEEANSEDIFIEFVDGKKRQRYNIEGDGSDNNKRVLEEGFKNALSATAIKLADRAQ
ncbi:hypothetical protein EPI10_000258 [Gossypium australe]|uniref:Uncharacterized protein n=1 Tax=Gossypium australe TaxID=47621 RepID=A0A5B6V7N7_9ROSI|nr:hypothetical protein EPI10_000258 [Gossypium australe]